MCILCNLIYISIYDLFMLNLFYICTSFLFGLYLRNTKNVILVREINSQTALNTLHLGIIGR